MNPRDVITHFDEFLDERELRLDAVVIGGTALALLGVIDRPTRDCDVLHPALPEEIANAARAFAAQLYQDANPDWPEHVRGVVADLKARLGHGV